MKFICITLCLMLIGCQYAPHRYRQSAFKQDEEPLALQNTFVDTYDDYKRWLEGEEMTPAHLGKVNAFLAILASAVEQTHLCTDCVNRHMGKRSFYNPVTGLIFISNNCRHPFFTTAHEASHKSWEGNSLRNIIFTPSMWFQYVLPQVLAEGFADYNAARAHMRLSKRMKRPVFNSDYAWYYPASEWVLLSKIMGIEVAKEPEQQALDDLCQCQSIEDINSFMDKYPQYSSSYFKGALYSAILRAHYGDDDKVDYLYRNCDQAKLDATIEEILGEGHSISESLKKFKYLRQYFYENL